jgi:hypothetical protein
VTDAEASARNRRSSSACFAFSLSRRISRTCSRSASRSSIVIDSQFGFPFMMGPRPRVGVQSNIISEKHEAYTGRRDEIRQTDRRRSGILSLKRLQPPDPATPSTSLPWMATTCESFRLLARRADGIHLAPFEQGEIGPDLFKAACNIDAGRFGVETTRQPLPSWPIARLDLRSRIQSRLR